MDAIRTDPHVYSVFASLLEGTWATGIRPFQNSGIEHSHRLLIYADRCNLRFPESILEETCCGGRPEGEMPMFLENVSENDADAAFLSGSALEAGSKRTRKKRGRSSTSWRKHLCPEKGDEIKIVALFCG